MLKRSTYLVSNCHGCKSANPALPTSKNAKRNSNVSIFGDDEQQAKNGKATAKRKGILTTCWLSAGNEGMILTIRFCSFL